MAHETKFIGNVKTPPGRLSFPKLDKPDTEGTYADDKYKTKLLIPKKQEGMCDALSHISPDIKELKAAVLECAREAFGPETSLKDIQTPFSDGDDSPDKAGHEGCIIIGAKRKSSRGRPMLIDRRKQQIDPSDAYGGVWARLVVSCMSYEGTETVRDPKTGKKTKERFQGVTLLLDAVQVLADGERFGGGAEAALDALDDDLFDDDDEIESEDVGGDDDDDGDDLF